jgi:hypothetical protein
MFVNFNVINQLGSPAIYEAILEDRPAPGYPGRLFFSTDAKGIFRDTGTSWTLLASIGSGTPLDWGEVLDLGGRFGGSRYADLGDNALTFGNLHQFNLESTNGTISIFDSVGNISLGDLTNINSNLGVSLFISQKDKSIFTNGSFVDYTAIAKGIYLQFENKLYQLGDFNAQDNGNYFTVYDNENTISTNVANNTTGLFLQYSTMGTGQTYNMSYGEGSGALGGSYSYCEYITQFDSDIATSRVGAFYQYVYDNYSEIDYEIICSPDLNYYASYYFNGSNIGLKLEFNNKIYSFGDFDGINDATSIVLNDTTQTIGMIANTIALSGGLTTTGIYASTGTYLKITINNIEYKIDLLATI